MATKVKASPKWNLWFLWWICVKKFDKKWIKKTDRPIEPLCLSVLFFLFVFLLSLSEKQMPFFYLFGGNFCGYGSGSGMKLFRIFWRFYLSISSLFLFTPLFLFQEKRVVFFFSAMDSQFTRFSLTDADPDVCVD